MISGDIQKSGRVRFKGRSRVKLKTAYFQDQTVCLSLGVHQIHQGSADIASHQGMPARSPQQLSHQGGGSGFAIGTTDRGHWQPQVSAGHFQFTDQGDTSGHSILKPRQLRRHSGAGNDNIKILPVVRLRPPHIQIDLEMLQGCQGWGQVCGGGAVRGRHLSLSGGKKTA